MHMLYRILCYLVYFEWYMYLFTYTCMYGLFRMNLSKMCCWFNHHFRLLTNLISILWCIFTRVFPFKTRTITGFQGAHSLHPQCVRTSLAPSLSYYSCHTLATNRAILLSSMRNNGQGITIWPIVGTPTLNDMGSNWNFLLIQNGSSIKF